MLFTSMLEVPSDTQWISCLLVYCDWGNARINFIMLGHVRVNVESSKENDVAF